MATFSYSLFAGAAACVFTICLGYALTNIATAAAAAQNVSAAPTNVALVTLEQSAYEAWKSKDAKFWHTFLSDKFVGWGSSGRLDKSAAIKEYSGADCEIKSYAPSNEHTSPLGKDAMLITHKVSVDSSCGGHKLAADSWTAGVYVRDGDKWKGAFHAQAPIVDPKAAPAKPVGRKDAHRASNDDSPDGSARTAAMLAIEKTVWEACRQHDLTAADISFINIFWNLPNKTDALKDWSGTGCNVASVGIADAEGTMLSPTVGILTFEATADGTCYGRKVGPVWGTSVYVKDGDTWKWTFGINLPAPLKSTQSLASRSGAGRDSSGPIEVYNRFFGL